MADIGISYSSNPARLIQDSGRFLSDNIRQIGQQVQGTILELNTRKDIARMAENLSSLNVQSEAFPIQAAQVFAAHPLAAQDGRGQMVLKALGQAHHDWRQTQVAMNRGPAFVSTPQGIMDKRTGAITTPAPTKPMSVFGVGLVDPLTGETIVPEGTRTSPGASAPKTLSPGAILVDPQGKKIAENPKAAPSLTPYQSEQLKRSDRKAQVDALKTEIGEIDKNITSAVRQYELSYKREKEAANAAEQARHQADKTAIGQVADDLKKKKEERLKALQDLMTADDEAGDLGLPPVGADAAAPAQNDVVLVIDPQGRPGKIPASQLEAALQNGFKRR